MINSYFTQATHYNISREFSIFFEILNNSKRLDIYQKIWDAQQKFEQVLSNFKKCLRKQNNNTKCHYYIRIRSVKDRQKMLTGKSGNYKSEISKFKNS